MDLCVGAGTETQQIVNQKTLVWGVELPILGMEIGICLSWRACTPHHSSSEQILKIESSKACLHSKPVSVLFFIK